MEFAFTYQFRVDNKENVSQWHVDLRNGDLTWTAGNWLLYILR